MPKRPRIQLTVCRLPGAEAWFLIEHPWGRFRVPADVSLLDVVDLVETRTNGDWRRVKSSSSVRVPLAVYLEMQARQLPPDIA